MNWKDKLINLLLILMIPFTIIIGFILIVIGVTAIHLWMYLKELCKELWDLFTLKFLDEDTEYYPD